MDDSTMKLPNLAAMDPFSIKHIYGKDRMVLNTSDAVLVKIVLRL